MNLVAVALLIRNSLLKPESASIGDSFTCFDSYALLIKEVLRSLQNNTSLNNIKMWKEKKNS